MNKKMKKNAFMLAALALGGESFMATGMGYKVGESRRPKRKKKKPIPKGAKEYYFTKDGDFATQKKDSVFQCIARDDKNAKRKFDNWNKENEQ